MSSKKIKNKHYRNFLDNGFIDILTPEQIEQALNNVKGKHTKEGRSLIIALYYTGGRPNEVLRHKGKHYYKVKNNMAVKMPPSKGGLPRTIYLPLSRTLVKELYAYATTTPPEMLLFYNFISKYTRQVHTKKGLKYRQEISNKLRYHFNKWFKNILDEPIPPYYLRHNRFSQLSQAGVSLQDIRMIKGSRTTESITPYLHLSTKAAKSIARKIQ